MYVYARKVTNDGQCHAKDNNANKTMRQFNADNTIQATRRTTQCDGPVFGVAHTFSSHAKDSNAMADLEGAENGLDYEKCREYLLTLDGMDKGTMAQILCGGIIPRDRAFCHGVARMGRPYGELLWSGLCHCTTDFETRTHRWWFCPKWESLRPDWMKLQRHS